MGGALVSPNTGKLCKFASAEHQSCTWAVIKFESQPLFLCLRFSKFYFENAI